MRPAALRARGSSRRARSRRRAGSGPIRVADERPAAAQADRASSGDEPVPSTPTSSNASSAASRILELAQHDHRRGLDRAADNSWSPRSTSDSSRGTASPTLVSEGRFRTSPGALVGVLDHQYDGTPEVRVEERRSCDQELAPRAVHSDILATRSRMRPPGGPRGSSSSRCASMREPDRFDRLGLDLEVEPRKLGDHLKQVHGHQICGSTAEPAGRA